MPWCPKCRNEYIEGIETCSDCGVALVEELPEEINLEAPVILYTVKDEEIGNKFITYLKYGGIQTAGLLPDEDGELGIAVAGFEKEAAEKMFAQFESMRETEDKDISNLVQEIEQQLQELEEEEANVMLSELRTEASSVYVKKKDKYADLKFSGISFIVFAFLGFGLLLLNLLGYLNFFNKFSMLIMGAIFVIFLIIGIISLLRAGRLKNIVSEEEKVTNEVLDWVDENITDEVIASYMNEELSEEDNYFSVHSKLCQLVADQFPLFSKGYIDQLMDDRYNDYCEQQLNEE
ncbi:MAG: hypothetical protein J1F22_04240 [Lachnospiraceae bacterium]|nr:hypothetical protein [Lachnospiraceae bacterium]